MTRSMTAYGRGKSNNGEWLVELQSLNRKVLEIIFSMPQELLALDCAMRRQIGAQIQRGQIMVRVQRQLVGSQILGSYTKNLRLLKQNWEELAREIKLDPDREITLEFLVNQLPATSLVELAEYPEELRLALFKALDMLLDMKEDEGAALQRDLQDRVRALQGAALELEQRSAQSSENYREKLLAKLSSQIGEKWIEDERMVREVVQCVDRMDITEEITRLRSHLAQFSQWLSSDKPSIGRTLDFLVQEMLREVNTIGAKMPDLSSLGVSMKSDLEKIREQVQNIE